MANSSLLRTGEQDPVVTRGHGTAALGPSDSTDSGSDIQGGPGLNNEDGLEFDRGTTSDPDRDGPRANAGADMGDADLDSDTDRGGTGERAAAGRDSTLPTDEILSEERIEGVVDEEDNPHDFSPRGRRGRRTTAPLDDVEDDDAIQRVEDLDEERAAAGGDGQPGIVSGGIGAPTGTGRSASTAGPESGRNRGRR